ncbi:MAG TPA: AsmA family protein, partial [Gammaproteobacteria bacterium]|nr:AsmA family protein [Gammaproteobacteria bacterium]
MATTLKIFKWTALSLIALLAGLILLAVFINWNWVGDYAARKISEQAGRKFTIGDLNVDLWSLQPHLQATKIRVENAPWGEPPQMVKLGALETSIDLMQLIKGRVVIPELIIDQPIVHLEKSKGKANWQLSGNKAAQKPLKQKAEPAAPLHRGELPALGKLVIRNGQITYHDPAAKQAMTLAIANISGSTFGPGGKVTLDGHGRLQRQPWRLDFNAGAFKKLVETRAPYPIHLSFDMADTRARVNGKLMEPVKLAAAKVNFSLQGPGLKMLSSFLGPSAPQLPAYDVEGHVTRAGQIWRVQDFRAEVGKSDLAGELAFDTGRKRPMLKMDLLTHRLDYTDFAGLAPPSKQKKKKPKPLNLKFLRTMEAIVNIHGDKILAPKIALRDVRAAVRLNDGRLHVAPLSVSIGGGRVRAQALLDANPEPFKASLQTDVQRLNLSKLSDAAPKSGGTKGILDGHVEISVTGASAQAIAKNGGPAATLERLAVEDSHFTYVLPESKTNLSITADSIMAGEKRQIKVDGKGRYRGEPFKLDFTGDPPLELANTKTNKPYAIKFKASGANTNIAVAGTLQKPLTRRDIDLRLSVKGAGTDRLAAALGKPLSNIPPFSFQGRLRCQGADWTMNDFESRVGKSDLTGDIAIDTDSKRPFIKADLISHRLDYADFKTVMGAKSGKENATNAEQQPKKAATRAAGKPAEPPIDLAPLQKFNARISFQGKQMIAPNLPLEDVVLAIALQDGRLAIEPFNLGVTDGTVRGALTVDSSTPIRGRLTAHVDHIDIQKLVKPYDLKATFGILNGRTNMSIVGATKGQIAAAAEQTALTFIHSLVIKDTQFAYRDADSQIDVKTSIATTQTSNGAEPITIKSRGHYQGEAFNLNVGAGSLLRLLEAQRPYPIEAHAAVAKTKARIKGDVTQL